jgi:PAS domain S-box-containing protein
VVTYVDLASEANTPLYVSPQVEHVLGVTPAEWMQNPSAFWDLIHPDDVDRVRAEHLSLGTSTEPFRSQYRLVRPDGQLLWVHDQMVFVPSDTDDYGMWYGTLSVVSDDKMTEDALSTSAERLRLAIDGAALGTWEWSIPDDVLHISRTFATLLGLPSQTKTLPRADLRALLHPDDRASLSEAMRRSSPPRPQPRTFWC